MKFIFLKPLCLALFLTFLTLLLAIQLHDIRVASQASEAIINNAPKVDWQMNTRQTVDFKGDGSVSYSMIGYKANIVTVGVQTPYRKEPYFLCFDIDPNVQAAICSKPATLTTEKLNCQPFEEELLGCNPLPDSRGLVLYGGECDGIRIYWNSITQDVQWWRR